MLNTDYFYSEDLFEQEFITFPRALISESMFRGLSLKAKILYGFLCNKLGNSSLCNWIDEKNRDYVSCEISEMENFMGVKAKQIKTYLAELKTIGLLLMMLSIK